MAKIDLKTDRKDLNQPSPKAVAEVDVPSLTYLMIDGEGGPNSSKEFAAALDALFAVACAVKFAVRKEPAFIDYSVMPLEGLWQADDMSNFVQDKPKWKWTAMIAQPPFVSRETINAAVTAVKAKKNWTALGKLRVDRLKEGPCAQIMHVGPFSEEGPAIEKLHRFIEAKGRRPAGRHHEIYLSDIRGANPSRWKTIIRQPMR